MKAISTSNKNAIYLYSDEFVDDSIKIQNNQPISQSTRNYLENWDKNESNRIYDSINGCDWSDHAINSNKPVIIQDVNIDDWSELQSEIEYKKLTT